MIKHIVFFVVLLASWQLLYAQVNQINTTSGSFQGILKDNQALPVEGAIIGLKGTVRSTVSNSEGFFEIKNLPFGAYTLQIRVPGQLPIEKEIVFDEKWQGALEVSAPSMDEMQAVLIEVGTKNQAIEALPHLEDNALFSGKKTHQVWLGKIDANLATNNTRQAFGRIPGISIWENDGSGVQIGVASRGLSPNRSWEFNVRQNGYDVSADPLGYPEAYFNPPLEAVERIQVVRGASSLQFGPQFGGLLNYIIKKGDNQKRLTFETQNTIGSYGLFSSYNAIGGTVGKLNYYTYLNRRSAEGWRENSQYRIDNGHIQLSYAFSNRLQIGLEYTRLYYENQQPGGLTDAQFSENPQQSLRSRNWFSTPWNTANISLDYYITDNTRLHVKVFGLIAERNSIGFTAPITVKDTFNTNTGSFNLRQIDRDTYKNWGTEARLVSEYTLGKIKNILATGVRYYQGSTYRRQRGVGDAGTEFTLDLVPGAFFNNDLHLTNTNIALFAENMFSITERLAIIPGIRYELISTGVEGRFGFQNDGTPNIANVSDQQRSFVLLGIGAEYHLSKKIEVYGNFSQAYRPVQFSDLTPSATTDRIDPNLQDANGFNADLGVRGQVGKFLNFDVGAFYLKYNDRVGRITQLDDQQRAFQLVTNVGNSITQGVEGYIEVDPIGAFIEKPTWGNVSLFVSSAVMNAEYASFKRVSAVNNQLQETDLKGKRVENAPYYIHRFGANYKIKDFSITWQVSLVGDVFSDANNTEAPSANGTTGKIPAYEVMDLSASYRFLKNYNLKAGINNLTDKFYFTRRAGGYPGPGLMPADGRTFYVSVGAKF